MAEIKFTEDQKKAIEIRDKNLLVSAAAGSGKTAVLVERIIRRVLDDKDPLDVDRILVMTFTRAAADQMREKILNAIEEKKALDPFNTHLQKQSSLVHTAHISTIHGFCSELLRNHFNEAHIDPDFRVADEGESKLLKADALAEILEEEYERESSKEGDDGDKEGYFLILSESLSVGKNDNKLEDIILSITDQASSHADPYLWLDKAALNYEEFGLDSSDEGRDTGEYIKWMDQAIRGDIKELSSLCEQLLSYIRASQTLESYEPAIESDKKMLLGLLESSSYFELSKGISQAEFIKLGSGYVKKNDGSRVKVDPSEGEFVKEGREIVKNAIAKLKKSLRSYSFEEEKELCNDTAALAKELVRVVKRFIERYSSKKREANVVDYSDLEHLALGVLRDRELKVNEEYRELFKEIYVDEYQDSNLVQEELVNAISRGNNVFMVGDVKQSIYGFRMTRPEMFMEKYLKFSKGELLQCQVVDLKENFRSRKEVIDSVNEVFRVIMHKDRAKIEYDDSQALKNAMHDYPSHEANENISELLMIRKEEGVDNKELEAMVMADKIKKLKEKLKVYDPDIKGERGLNYRDIVILLRSSTGILSYKKVLEDNMIPVHVVNDEGYFEAREVALILDYLKIIDNPYQDIPFTAVLSSYFCGLNEDEIALLRNLKREENMYDSLKAILNNTLFIKNDTGKTEINNADLDDFISKIIEEDGIKIKKIFDSAVIKTNAFLSRLQAIRDKVGYSPVYDLIREILDKGYYRHCSSLVNGERKCANLDMLLKKAEDYAKTSYKGLFQFIRYIDKLKKYEVDYGEANLVDEKDDNVRIMTIHKSKGLEFPVCIIPNINKRYNEKDLSGEILIDPDMGIGLDNIKADKRIRKKTLIKEVIKEKKKRELRAEEMRILYVAMTRAREKVIMTALCDDPQKELDKLRSLADANSYFSLFMYARQEGNIKSISFNDTSIKDITRERVKKEILRDEAARRLKSILNDFEGSKEGEKRRAEDIFDKEELPYYKLFKSNLDYVYEREDSESSYEKHTVTELKEKHLDREEQEGIEELLLQPDLNNEEEGASLVPRFMQDSIEIPANIHGSAVHRIFEIWDYGHKRGEKDVRDFIEDSVDRGLITLEMAASVRVKEIYDFVNSDLAERMRRADMEGKLHREQPFVIELDEKLIQGIIDAYFIEDDKIVVVDYKTDRVKESTILRKRYEIQLDYYARALKKMLSKPVKERIIYSTVLKESVLL